MNWQNNLFCLTAIIILALNLVSCEQAPPPLPPTLSGETEIIIGTGFPLESQVYGDTRTINVYLPLGYAERPEDFPVLYLVDGGTHQDFIPMAGMAALATLSGQYRDPEPLLEDASIVEGSIAGLCHQSRAEAEGQANHDAHYYPSDLNEPQDGNCLQK